MLQVEESKLKAYLDSKLKEFDALGREYIHLAFLGERRGRAASALKRGEAGSFKSRGRPASLGTLF